MISFFPVVCFFLCQCLAARAFTAGVFSRGHSNFAATTTLFMKKSNSGGGSSSRSSEGSELYVPKTKGQILYRNELYNKNSSIVVCVGPAGTGKTAIACHYAVEQLLLSAYKKIVITRPVVTVEEDIGFLPGNINKKMEPWMRPMMDIFQEYYSLSAIENMMKTGVIEISPLAYMRGRTFKNAVILADEMQNSSPNQMLMITTRIGDASKLIITGDLNQTDMKESGLKDLLVRYRRFSGRVENFTEEVKLIQMNNTDIIRHPVVSKILDLYSIPLVAPPKAAQAPVSSVVFTAGYSNRMTDDCAMIPIHEYNKTVQLKNFGSNGIEITKDNCL